MAVLKRWTGTEWESVGAPAPSGTTVPSQRQGGSATDWNTSGTTTQTINASKVRTQVGSFTFTGIGANLSGLQAITFPTAYAAKPMVFTSLSQATGDGRLATSADSITATGCNVILTNFTAVTNVGGTVHWMAIGEIA